MNNIPIKTEQEISVMRAGGKLLAEILQTLRSAVKPGMSTLDLEKIAQDKFKEMDLVPSFKGYHGFPAFCCISVNEEVVHGIPKPEKIIKSGDLVKIDCGVYYKNMHTDSAITVIVEDTNPEIKNFVQTTENALMAGIEKAIAGNHIGDISAAVQKTLEAEGYGVVRECTGHGIGKNLHEPPNVPNYGEEKSGLELKPGMTIAIEPISTLGNYRIMELEDGWTIITKDSSLSAHAEHTIIITEGEAEIITKI